VPTSFLAPLPGNGSNTSLELFQLYTFHTFPHIHMEFSPSYPDVPSREYLQPPPSCHAILSDGYEIHPSLIAMVCAQSFSGRKDESSYAHLQEFEQNCSMLTISGMNQNTLRWKLFPFSLTGEAKIWYDRKAGRVRGDWIKLKDEFCLFFFLVTKVFQLRIQLLTFMQGEELIGVAWERFMLMANFGPPHGIPEEMLMSTSLVVLIRRACIL
jgi:hypothetical protein